MIGASQVAPRVRELTKNRDQVEISFLIKQVYEAYGEAAKNLLPIQCAIVESELVDIGWRRRSQTNIFEKVF
jgi:hypothetical protein